MLVLTNTLATALTLGLFTPWAQVRTIRYKIQHLILKSSGDLNTFVADKQKEVGALWISILAYDCYSRILL